MCAAPDSDAVSFPTLVGRERERRILRDHLDAALAGQGGLVLIGGEAGIGKTALAEALSRDAIEQGALVLVGRCYDLTETPPYGPWVELFGRYREDDGYPVRPAAFAQRGTVGEVTSQTALFEQVQAFLITLATQRPLVLVLDDLHWADPASLDLLRSLARSLATLPLLLVATYRTDEVTRQHPLYALVPLLIREAATSRLDLRRLHPNAIGVLVERRYQLIAADAARLATYLDNRTEGNPLFLRELLRSLEEEGTLDRTANGWGVGDLSRVTVPLLLRQVIDGRVARLGMEAQRLLGVAAVIGQELPLILWATVANAEEESVLTVVERAGDAYLLEETPDGTGMRFTHALIREALYVGLSLARRRVLHRHTGEALIALPSPDPDAVAAHFRQAGDARAAEWLVKAGERAQHAYAWLTAAERFEAALALTDKSTATARERGWLLMGLANLRRYADTQQSIGYTEEASHLAAAANDPFLSACTRFYRGMFRGYMGDIGRAVAEMEGALAELVALRVTTDPPALVPDPERVLSTERSCRGTLALWLAFAGRYMEARAFAEQVIAQISAHRDAGGVDALRTEVDPALAVNAFTALAFVHAASGQPDEARRVFAGVRERYRAYGHHVMVGWAAAQELVWALLPYQSDRVAERRALAAEAEQAWLRATGAETQHLARFAHLPLLFLEGRWAEARDSIPQETPRSAHAQHALPVLIQLAREQGNVGRAWTLVREMFPTGSASEPADHLFLPAIAVQRLAAMLALDAGDLLTAHARLSSYDHWLTWSDAVLGQAEGDLGWATYYRAIGNRAKAEEHVMRALAHATEPRQPLALLAAHRLMGELDTDAGRYDSAAVNFDASLSLADACLAPYERALTLLARAALHGATGDTSGVTTPLNEAREIFTRLDAKPALAHVGRVALTLLDAPKPAYPAGLSAREVEVLRLVAAGLTNAQVAERLFLSPRTVNGHLTAIYTKLDVPSRAAAIRFALDHGLT